MTNVPYFDQWIDTKFGDYGWFHWKQKKAKGETCPYCREPLNFIHGPWNQDEYKKRYVHELLRVCGESLAALDVLQCAICGWWQVTHLNADDMSSSNYSRGWLSQAVIKVTNISSTAVPVGDLAAYLSKHDDKIYQIHHKKMEELVGAVLREHFDCKVVYCGRTGDRGIDLLLVLSDDIIPIQVKRRTRRNCAEPVSIVRDLLGVIFRDRRRSGIIVTTADRFSSHARRDAHEVIEKGLVDRFDLLDVHSFMAILRRHYGDTTRSYLSSIPKLLGGQLQSLDLPVGHRKHRITAHQTKLLNSLSLSSPDFCESFLRILKQGKGES